MYFCKVYDYGEKADLSKSYWNPKRKMWVTTPEKLSNHNSKKSVKIQRMYGNFFPNLSSIISE